MSSTKARRLKARRLYLLVRSAGGDVYIYETDDEPTVRFSAPDVDVATPQQQRALARHVEALAPELVDLLDCPNCDELAVLEEADM